MRDLHGEWFGGEDVVLLAYFLGQPKRALLEFGTQVAGTVRSRELGMILDSCIDEGTVAQNPFNQFERFNIELSIRLYWLEKEYLGDEEDISKIAAAPRLRSAPAPGFDDGGNSQARSGWVVAILVVSALALTGMLGAAWWKFYPTTQRVYVFPDYDMAPRLSAPHSGGGHAVMFFGKREAETLVYGSEPRS